MSSTGFSPAEHQPVPFYRNVKVLAVLAQVAFAALVGFILWWLYSNMIAGLRRSNIPLDFNFFSLTAGFDIADTSIPYQPTDSYARALQVGLLNTLRVSVIGIVLATILGVLIGIGRLSSNWLLRSIALVYVEIFRNTPLSVQLIFWAQAVILKLPRVRESIGIDGVALVSNRGMTVAWPAAGPGFTAWQPWLWAGLLAGVVVFAVRRTLLRRADRPGAALPQALLASGVTVFFGAIVTGAVTSSPPLIIDQPQFQGFNYTGGATLGAAFVALLLGLTLYTAAFIAEVVRGGIQSVSKGQREAAQSLGLTPAQAMRLIIFPQALRVIIPPLTNQYLNLTKNSSLGILIAFADLFFVANTINNQSGRTVQMIVILMGCYLSLSLLTSLITNLYNRRVRLVER
jgi:general L-amino acid transport system permease protein